MVVCSLWRLRASQVPARPILRTASFFTREASSVKSSSTFARTPVEVKESIETLFGSILSACDAYSSMMAGAKKAVSMMKMTPNVRNARATTLGHFIPRLALLDEAPCTDRSDDAAGEEGV